MIFRRFFINLLVKKTYGFWPDKKIKNGSGATIYQASLIALDLVLIKHAREKGEIDNQRAYLLERSHGHFVEHIMFTEPPAEEVLGVLEDMNNDYDRKGRSVFHTEYEKFIKDACVHLPTYVNKELITHLAFFQRIDGFPIDEVSRKASVRDLHGLIFGHVTPSDIEEILNVSAGYSVDHRRA
ncbi:MAG: hypothetical protein P8104_01800 [Gammaproteobacteria bacterium]